MTPSHVTTEPIVAVVGVGVTGTRVATNLATGGGLRIAVTDQRNDVAVVTARSIGGAAVDLDHAQFADVAVLALPCLLYTSDAADE